VRATRIVCMLASSFLVDITKLLESPTKKSHMSEAHMRLLLQNRDSRAYIARSAPLSFQDELNIRFSA